MKSLSATLYCNRVSKTISGKPVLNDISFSAYPGETIALIGPNGAGKTTLLKTLGGLIAPDRGEVNVLGRIMNPENRDMLLSQIGMLIGIPVFERGMSVQAILRRHLAFMRCDWSPDNTLERVGLTSMGDLPVDILSMGNRMRLALATALAHHPTLLLLDEPMNGLDPTGMKLFRRIIREENERGATVIVSAHMLAQLEAIGDQVIVINHGSIKAQNAMNDISDLESYYFRHTQN
ncbi:ABC transporter ATP-binding protein [Bifidobacterium olomucense]|uniref:ABC transporter ATP-binding protein n=1 Tax=Bifidobacterium olomucense TaxID=2675324 RepID=A0A7Y0HWQ3_9BIFI|nr:ABC transporter ATP-binding protein [Bifidobacterium sp. DSM 109959]NMM97159.1 ABC transporter ATP-binding protein [Bifidobacterium sp. DSM 109959]